MHNKWKWIVVILFAILTCGLIFTTIGMFSIGRKIDGIANENNSPSRPGNDSSNTDNIINSSKPNVPDNSPSVPEIIPDDTNNKEDDKNDSIIDNPTINPPIKDEIIEIPTPNPTPNPDTTLTPNKPENGNDSNNTPPIIEDSNNSNSNGNNNVVVPPQIPSEPIPDTPNYDEINSDQISLEKEKSIAKYLDTYKFAKNTTYYQDYFLKNKQLAFDAIKIKNNIYQIIREAILKTGTYNEESMTLSIKIRYQLQQNNQSVRLWIQWSTKLKDIGFNVIKNYYNKLIIKLN